MLLVAHAGVCLQDFRRACREARAPFCETQIHNFNDFQVFKWVQGARFTQTCGSRPDGWVPGFVCRVSGGPVVRPGPPFAKPKFTISMIFKFSNGFRVQGLPKLVDRGLTVGFCRPLLSIFYQYECVSKFGWTGVGLEITIVGVQPHKPKLGPQKP
jgi:hypothetical protein